MGVSVVQQRPASSLPNVLYWAQLEHFLESDYHALPQSRPSKPIPLEPSVMNPGFWTADGVVRKKGPLQSYVNEFINRLANLPESEIKEKDGQYFIRHFGLDFTFPKSQRRKVKEALKRIKEIRYALVDLSKGTPEYVGNSGKDPSTKRELDLQQALGASLLKIAAMYGAYQLQYDLNVMAQKNPTWTTKELFAAARDAWRRTQVIAPGEKPRPARPPGTRIKIHDHLFLVDGAKVKLDFSSWNPKHSNKYYGAPNLENIFNEDSAAVGDRGVSFKKSAYDSFPEVEEYLRHLVRTRKHADQNKIRELDMAFYDRLLLMVDASDNAAANSCIMDLGFLYIHSALLQSDLFNPNRGGGMWLSLPYGGPVWAAGTGVGRGSQHVSPAAAAAFMTLLATDSIVSPFACQEMLWLLYKAKQDAGGNPFYYNGEGSQTISVVANALEGGDLKPTKIYSKLGLFQANKNAPLHYSDCALVEREEHGSRYRYVVAIIDFDVPGDWDWMPRDLLLVGLDRCIKQNNSLIDL